MALQQQDPGRAAQLPHHGGGRRSLADHVAHRHGQAAAGQGDRVVPVAPDLQRVDGRLVPDGQALPVQLGQQRKQAALQELGDLVLGLPLPLPLGLGSLSLGDVPAVGLPQPVRGEGVAELER